MRYGGRVWAVASILVALTSLPTLALGLTVESAGESQVVSGIVTVTATDVTADAYVILRADGKYLSAIGAPFTYEWDTRDLEDGRVTLQATAVGTEGPVGAPVTTTVMVANSLEIEGPVALEWAVKAGDTIKTSIRGECDVYDDYRREAPQKYVPARLYRALAGQIAGAATDTVVEATDARVLVDRSLDRLVVDCATQVIEVAGSGHSTQFTVLATGGIGDGEKAGAFQARAAMLWIPLPAQPVEARTQWTGDLVFMESAHTGSVRHATAAQHEILGFRTWKGERCALVERRVRYRDDFIVKFAADEERFPRSSTFVRRLSYFSLDSGRVLRAEETVERWMSVKSDEWGITPEAFLEPTTGTTGGAEGERDGEAGGSGSRLMGGSMPTGPLMGAGGSATMTTLENVPDNVDLVYSIRTIVDAE